MVYFVNQFAKYNVESNNQMIKIIEENFDNPWNYPLNGYCYKTLGEILEHVYITDNNWMEYILKCTNKILIKRASFKTQKQNDFFRMTGSLKVR